MSDPTATPDPGPAGHEVEIDLAAFLPEGTTLADPDPDLGAPASEPEPEPHAARPGPVDLEVLTQIEADLAAVDAALVAIDRGDLDGSPLLVELLAPPA